MTSIIDCTVQRFNKSIQIFNGKTRFPFSAPRFPKKYTGHRSPVLSSFSRILDLGLRIWVFIFHYSLNKSCSTTEGDCFTSLRFVRNDLTGHRSSIKTI